MNGTYRICVRCVMDTTDPEIAFDAEGACNHCRQFDETTSKNWFPNEEGARKLQLIIERIKRAGARGRYDCILGLSGGVDSSYLALRARDWGLRPLVVHVDAGWNSELAVANIENIIKYCGYDLHTHVVDWREMRALQIAYLRSGVANQDVPQDHVFFASLYRFATRNNVRYVLSGGNIATESIVAAAWDGNALDRRNLMAIQGKFRAGPLKSYPTVSFFQHYVWFPFVKRMRVVRPLNYLPYDRAMAIRELESTIGWRSYDRKHGESLFTRFFQNYYLPLKFGYDKRRPHLSSLIVSGQITRDAALVKLQEPLYEPIELETDITFLCKKLQISRAEFNELMAAPIHHYSEFRNQDRLYGALKHAQRLFETVFDKRVVVYS